MNRLVLLAIAPCILGGLSAQSNSVVGLDGRVTLIGDPTYYGRRGGPFPNGEIGMAFANTMCNPGSVTIPWFQAMQPNHPKFGFMIVRVANDRIEQINDWSFCKHAFLSVNVSGLCGVCQNPGTTSVMGIACSDTYSAANNSDRVWLGPPGEIDPWLGTWNPVGSYFDIGDPAQAGFPAPADGVRSLSQAIFDNVDNRVTIKEVDLLTPDADYYYGLQLIHEGERVTVRGDNLAHRGLNPQHDSVSGTWTFGNSAVPQEYGSILSRWPGASVNSAGNGGDDGRFFVACKVTWLGGGAFHYEYAVHNVDNSRAGATFRIPIDAGATATNFTFGDIDANTGNDWSAGRIGNEIVFAAPAGNALEWNRIYNFGFDADIVPGAGAVELDAARPGAGATFVSVATETPSGAPIAAFEKFGAGCPISQTPTIQTCQSWNTGGGQLLGTVATDEYAYRVANAGSTSVGSFDLYCHSTTGGPVTVSAYLYAQNVAGPKPTPLAATTITVDSAPGFYRASFPTPVAVTGSFFLAVDSTAQDIVLSEMSAGQPNISYWRSSPGALWSQRVLIPGWKVQCTNQPLFPEPSIDTDALPLLGTTYNVTLADGVAQSVAVLVSGTSSPGLVGVAIPGAPGCELFVSLDVLEAVPVSAAGTASSPISVPAGSALLGFQAFHQWGVLDIAANALGVVVSDAGHVTVGQ